MSSLKLSLTPLPRPHHPPDDYRMFAGDLGNDVTEELLNRHFSCYPSFVKSKVVRDKFTNKSKGFGFLSFKEPADYTRAMKEMNGEYHYAAMFPPLGEAVARLWHSLVRVKMGQTV